MPKPSSQPTYAMASSVLAERSTSGVPRHTGAASTATTAIIRLKTGSALGSSSREAPNDAVTPTPVTRARTRSTGRPACSKRRTTSHSAAALAITTSVLNIHPGALTTMSRNTGSSTRALSRRFRMPDPRGAPNATLVGMAMSHPTEAAVAALVVGDGAIGIRGAEVGPERRRHPELGIGDLPQQEVRDAHLAARADEQVGIRQALGVERAADVRLRHRVRRQLARLHAPREDAKGVEQLVAPAVVDGDVGGHRVRADGLQQRGLGGDGHQKDMISCSFFFRSSSILAMNLSVVFWIWSWPRRSSSSVIGALLSLASAFSLSLASRRTLRTATRASSAILWTFLTSCLRRSSVGVGIVSRMTLPSFTGWMPRSDFMIAFSTSLSWAASHGWIMSVRASGTETEAI